MSILINGMEMPTSRGEYEMRMYVDSDGTATVEGAYCRFEGEPFEAVPVPPHGRLIDADALYSHIKDEQRKCNDPYEGWSECQVALGFVNTAPTIIPAEEGE